MSGKGESILETGIKETNLGYFPGDPVAKTLFPMQGGPPVQSLVRALDPTRPKATKLIHDLKNNN